MKKLLVMCACCLIKLSSHAQTEDKKWNVGVQGGLIQFHGDIGHGLYKTDQAAYAFGGISVSRYLGKYMDASMFITRGEAGFIDHTRAATTERPNSFLVRTNTSHLVANLYFTKPEAVIRPFIMAGAGVIWYEKVYKLNTEHFVYSLPTFGGGLVFNMGPVVSLRLQESFMYTTADHIDYVTEGTSTNELRIDNDMHLYHSAGLAFNIGRKKDADKDGVVDKKDLCPGTPMGVAVNETGCPLDRDNDGIADYLDECADVAGIQSLKGCPDKDMDGITDATDRCPEVFGPAETKGCPDTDKDGVVDIDDKCAGTKTGYKVDATGCTLDNDKDGLVNEEDACPDKAGILAFKGCPDSDGDGVADNEDRCPSVKGTIANKGCAEIAKEDILRITVIASKIYFEFDSDKLKLISNSQLDDLASILQRYEGVNLTIEGHTDSDGNDDYNQDLSQRRTNSVKNYLISKGVDAGRLTAIGYGETKPIAPNKTNAGKAKNRRVELKTSY